MRRSLFGYRRADVEEALSEAEAEAGRQAELARAHLSRSQQLETALEQARQACFARDRRLAQLEAELDLSRSHAESRLRALAVLGAELEELRVTARGQATRIRLDALREAAQVSTRVRALAGAPEGAAEAMLAALERALDRLGRGRDGGEEGGPTAAELDAGRARASLVETAPDPAAEPAITATRSSELAELEAALEPPLASGSEALAESADSDRRVSIDIGPFTDFSQLVSFEDAANAIGATSEISIRRFSEGRASIDVSLREPVDLLRELESSCDLRFRVRRNDADGLILDLGE